jgi:hypothetical protein
MVPLIDAVAVPPIGQETAIVTPVWATAIPIGAAISGAAQA